MHSTGPCSGMINIYGPGAQVKIPAGGRHCCKLYLDNTSQRETQTSHILINPQSNVNNLSNQAIHTPATAGCFLKLKAAPSHEMRVTDTAYKLQMRHKRSEAPSFLHNSVLSSHRGQALDLFWSYFPSFPFYSPLFPSSRAVECFPPASYSGLSPGAGNIEPINKQTHFLRSEIFCHQFLKHFPLGFFCWVPFI